MALLNKANLKRAADAYTQEEKERIDQEYKDSQPIEEGPLAGLTKGDEKFFKWLTTDKSILDNLITDESVCSAPEILLMMAAGLVMDGIKLNDMKAIELVGTVDYKEEYPNAKFNPYDYSYMEEEQERTGNGDEDYKDAVDLFREFVDDEDNFITWAEVYSFVKKHKDIITPDWVFELDWRYIFEL